MQSKKRETRTVEGNALLSPVVDISACPVGLDWSRRKSVPQRAYRTCHAAPTPNQALLSKRIYTSHENRRHIPTATDPVQRKWREAKRETGKEGGAESKGNYPKKGKTRCRWGALLRGARDPITQQWPSPVVGCCSWKSQVLVTCCCCASTVTFVSLSSTLPAVSPHKFIVFHVFWSMCIAPTSNSTVR